MVKEERKEKLIARIELCDELWRMMVSRKRKTSLASQTERSLKEGMDIRACNYMMDVVQSHRSVAQTALVESVNSVVSICGNCGAPSLDGTCVVDGDFTADDKFTLAMLLRQEHEQKEERL